MFEQTKTRGALRTSFRAFVPGSRGKVTTVLSSALGVPLGAFFGGVASFQTTDFVRGRRAASVSAGGSAAPPASASGWGFMMERESVRSRRAGGTSSCACPQTRGVCSRRGKR